jgi:hypothetical protein
MSEVLFKPPQFLVEQLTRLVGAGLQGVELDVALAEAYTSLLNTMSRATRVGGQLTSHELASALARGGKEFASFSEFVASQVRSAKTLGDLTKAQGLYANYLRQLLTPTLRETAKQLGKAAVVEGLEVTTARAAAQQAIKAGAKSGGWRLGLRLGARRVLVGALGIVGTALTVIWIGSTIWGLIRPSSGPSNRPCPTPVLEYRRCPWTPQDASIQPCRPGFCWDGGFQGSLACKQEKDVPNSRRGELRDIICNDGYVAEQDPCTGVILRCVKS